MKIITSIFHSGQLSILFSIVGDRDKVGPIYYQIALSFDNDIWSVYNNIFVPPTKTDFFFGF